VQHSYIGITSYVREIDEMPTLLDCCTLGHNCYRINKFVTSVFYVYVLYNTLKRISDFFPVDFAFIIYIFSSLR